MEAESGHDDGEDAVLTGWGRVAPSRARVVALRDDHQLRALGEESKHRGILARGLGRSYGDAAQNAGGVVVDATAHAAIRSIDIPAGTVRVEGGVSLDALMRALLPFGLFPAVTPGTRHVTVGGALAADIHGKNHHQDGGFSDYITRASLWTPNGVVEIGPDHDAELFAATAGGMGLTGIVLDATLKLLPVETTRIAVDTERARDLDDLLARMETGDGDYRYSVAWIDCLARGARLGRGVLTRGDHARLDDLPRADRAEPLAFSPRARLVAPPWAPSGLLNPLSVRAFNELWFRKAPRGRSRTVVPLHAFFHPLDGVDGWNRLYGPRGFVQYQFVVPFGQEAALRRAIERLSVAGAASFLAVLKRFGPAGAGHLSFPSPGWTLALDLSVGSSGLAQLLDELDDLVAEAGGRVYLAKDARLRAELVPIMYPRLDEWRAVRDRVDPDRLLRSDLARRLDLLGERQ